MGQLFISTYGHPSRLGSGLSVAICSEQELKANQVAHENTATCMMILPFPFERDKSDKLFMEVKVLSYCYRLIITMSPDILESIHVINFHTKDTLNS